MEKDDFNRNDFFVVCVMVVIMLLACYGWIWLASIIGLN